MDNTILKEVYKESDMVGGGTLSYTTSNSVNTYTSTGECTNDIYFNCTSATQQYIQNKNWWDATFSHSYTWSDATTTSTTDCSFNFVKDSKYAYNLYTVNNNDWVWRSNAIRKDPRQAIRDIIRSQQAPELIVINKGRHSVGHTTDPKEINARQTLRMMIGAEAFRRFLKHGFVSIKAKSGLVYQMYRGHDLTNVYHDGELIERLCVVLSGGYTATDAVIMRYVMIQADEAGFKAKAIKHSLNRPSRIEKRVEPIDLNAEWKKLKEAA